MTLVQDDSLADVERNRLRLEVNIAKLRVSLQHWQTWEAEYEGLKEEIEALDGAPTTDDLMKIGRTFGGDLVNEREIKELVSYRESTPRTGKQVVGLLSRRIDYVQQNIRIVQKQLDVAEEKLSNVPAVTIPDMQNEEGLPLTEIQEELDEEGNIVSSTITHPGQAALEIVQALRQAGVTDLEPLKSSEGSLQHKVEANASRQESRLGKPDMTYDTVPAQLPPPEPLSENLLDDSLKVATKAPKKSVTPAENIEAPEPVHIPTPAAPSEPASYRIGPALARGSFHRGGRVIELDENDQEIGSTPTIPLGESPEDAARRRAMLEYSLSEVGAVVAELDLEDVDSADSYGDGDNDDENGDIYADDDEEEDEFGRSLRPGITDEYRDKMLELEKKLNARMLENVGPMPHNPALEEVVKSAHRLVVQKDQVAVETGAGSYRSSRIAKKGVRFADELNISSDPKPVPDEERPAFKKLLEKSTVSESIVERSPSAATLSAQTETLRKISRFKSTRAAAMPFITQNVSGTAAKSVNTSVHPANKDEHPQSKTDVPGFEPGEVLTTNVLERPVSLCNVSGPDEDALNPAILQREAAVAYHKIRNQMIQRNGGFLPSERDKLEEEEQGPLMEEKDGKVKKVSRFKAAWLGAGGV